MSTLFIESELVRVGVAPDFGARVVSLLDKRNGREWMTQGDRSPAVGEDAVYGGREAVGWDECFPTVGVWDGTGTAWGRRLRDHGDLWGRPWQVDSSGPLELTTTYANESFTFRRTLMLEGAALTARYDVTNHLEAQLPYLWALHSLFAVRPGDQIDLGGVREVHASFMAENGRMLGDGKVAWLDKDDRVSFPLIEVQPPSALFAGKFLVADRPASRARLGQPGQWLEIEWDERLASIGIWLTYGAWPQAGGHHEVAIEPTSSPANDLGEAISAGAMPLAPGERREWQVTLTPVADNTAPVR